MKISSFTQRIVSLIWKEINETFHYTNCLNMFVIVNYVIYIKYNVQMGQSFIYIQLLHIFLQQIKIEKNLNIKL